MNLILVMNVYIIAQLQHVLNVGNKFVMDVHIKNLDLYVNHVLITIEKESV